MRKVKPAHTFWLQPPFSYTMAPVKRKGNAPEDSSAAAPKKRVKYRDNEGSKDPKRKRKASEAGDSKDASKKERSDGSKVKEESAPRPAAVSVLREEQPAFPRGGSNVLTPIERKQINIEATKDVLFEQKAAGGKELKDSDDDESAFDETDKPAAAPKAKKRKSKASKSSTSRETIEKEGVRIEGLNYKVKRSCPFYSYFLMLTTDSASFRALKS